MKLTVLRMWLLLLVCIVMSGCNAPITQTDESETSQTLTQNSTNLNESTEQLHPMSIERLRAGEYPGSEITIVETLAAGSNYSLYIASYESDGNTINGLLTVPNGEPPAGGFPPIVFVHGYIPPEVYRTTERYVQYQDGFARNGFITYKIDLRGHADSEGTPVSAHYSEAYVVDTLNAISSLKTMEEANPEKIGYWGHSNGGEIGLRTMVVSDEIDAGVLWAGVVGSFEGMLETYNSQIPFLNLETGVPPLVQRQGLPSLNPEFWDQVDPYSYLSEVSGPVQLHHGTADNSVPVELSRELEQALQAANQPVELYEYQNGDHNIAAPHFSPAMQRSIEFFKTHLLTQPLQ